MRLAAANTRQAPPEGRAASCKQGYVFAVHTHMRSEIIVACGRVDGPGADAAHRVFHVHDPASFAPSLCLAPACNRWANSVGTLHGSTRRSWYGITPLRRGSLQSAHGWCVA
jgi:hypothetical protein